MQFYLHVVYTHEKTNYDLQKYIIDTLRNANFSTCTMQIPSNINKLSKSK